MKKPLLVSPMHCFILLLVFNYCFCIALQFLEGPFDHHLFRLQNPKVTNFNSVKAFWKQNGWNLIFKCTWNIPKFSLKIVFFKKIRISVFLQLYCITNACTYMYWSNQSFNTPPPPSPGIPRAFDTFAVLGRREFDYQSLPGLGNFIPMQMVGNLNRTLDFMWNLWALSIACGELSWRTQC